MPAGAPVRRLLYGLRAALSPDGRAGPLPRRRACARDGVWPPRNPIPPRADPVAQPASREYPAGTPDSPPQEAMGLWKRILGGAARGSRPAAPGSAGPATAPFPAARAAEGPSPEGPPQQDPDARALAEFVAERSRACPQRPELLNSVLAHALSPAAPDTPWGLLVTAEPGGGKSSLFAGLCAALLPRAGAGELVLLAHAVEASPEACRRNRMLRRWVRDLAHALGRPDPLARCPGEGRARPPASPATSRSPLASPAGRESARAPVALSAGRPGALPPDEEACLRPERLEAAFGSLLGQAASRGRVVVLLDGLEGCGPGPCARRPSWVPALWPANARLVAMAVPGEAARALASRPRCLEMALPPLSAREVRAAAERFFQGTGREPPGPQQLAPLLRETPPGRRPAWGNPLWLALALQTLTRIGDAPSAPTDVSSSSGRNTVPSDPAGLPTEPRDLFAGLIEDAARRCGPGFTQACLGLVALSRRGCPEEDLRRLVPELSGQPWDETAFAELRRTLGCVLARRGDDARWGLNHPLLRETVLGRLGEETARRAHALLADGLLNLALQDPLRAADCTAHLLAAGDRARLAALLSDLDSACAADARGEAPITAALETLADAILETPDEAARECLADWVAGLLTLEDGPRAARLARVFLHDLTETLAAGGPEEACGPRLRLLRAAQTVLLRQADAEPSGLHWRQHAILCCHRIAETLAGAGDLDGALSACREAAAAAQQNAAARPQDPEPQRLVALCRDKAADVLLARGDTLEALAACRDALAIARAAAKVESPDPGPVRSLVLLLRKTADVLLSLGDAPGALGPYREVLDLVRRMALADPSASAWQRELAWAWCDVGTALQEQGDLGKALRAYGRALAVRRRVAATRPDDPDAQRDLSVGCLQLGDVLLAQGRPARALRACRKALAIAERLAASDPAGEASQHTLSTARDRLGDALLAQGDPFGALRAYRDALAIAERCAAADPDRTAWQHELAAGHAKVGDVLLAQGRDTAALAAFRKSLAAAQRLADAEPANRSWQQALALDRQRLGDVLLSEGDVAGALAAYRDSLKAAERLAGSSPRRTGWQRLLSAGHGRVGDVLLAQGDQAGALQAYRQAAEAAQQAAEGAPADADRQHDLWVACWRVADLAQKLDLADAPSWWRKAYDALAGARARGAIRPGDERYLEELRRKAASSGGR